jgi:hypothetical protein
MSIFLTILEFIFSFIAIFFTWILIINIVYSVVNPNIIIENGQPIEKNNNARLMFSLIIALCWAFVIIIP